MMIWQVVEGDFNSINLHHHYAVLGVQVDITDETQLKRIVYCQLPESFCLSFPKKMYP